MIIDDDGPHGEAHSGETQAETRLVVSAGRANVKRQHMGKLQHNKTIVVDGSNVQAVVCGSTNFSWRGFFVQSNNAVVLRRKEGREGVSRRVRRVLGARRRRWLRRDRLCRNWSIWGCPRSTRGWGSRRTRKKNALLAKVGGGHRQDQRRACFYSLAFLYQTQGPIRDASRRSPRTSEIFVYGISDKRVGGIDLQNRTATSAGQPGGARRRTHPSRSSRSPPAAAAIACTTSSSSSTSTSRARRVYLGSYNFSDAADTKNGENLLLIRDRRIAVSYVVEAVRIFDHYHFRVAQRDAKKARKKLELARPPRQAGEQAWWEEHYTDARKIRDRELFI